MKTLLVAIILGLTLQFCGCITLPRIVSPSKPETTYNYSEQVVTKPTAVVVGKDGEKIVVVQEQTKSVEASYTVPKKGFMQRLGNWLGSLSIIGVVVLIIFLVLFPGATMAYLVKQVFKWRNALTETASAIKAAKAVENNNTLELALKEKQSDETKELLGKIRAKL